MIIKGAEHIKNLKTHNLQDPDAAAIAATDLVVALIDEARELIEARHAVTPEAHVAIYRELNQKWESICRKIRQDPEIPESFSLKPEGYKAILLQVADEAEPAIAAIIRNNWGRSRHNAAIQSSL